MFYSVFCNNFIILHELSLGRNISFIHPSVFHTLIRSARTAMPQSIYKRPSLSVETVATETTKAQPTTTMGKGYPIDPLCGVLPAVDKVQVSDVPDCLQRRRPGTLYCTGDSSSTVASFACHSSRSLATTAATSLSASLNNDLGRPSKHVSFPDELDTLKVENDHELTQEDIETIWWTIPDFKAFRKFCRKESK